MISVIPLITLCFLLLSLILLMESAMTHLPSTMALRAFEVAARRLNFTHTARELNLTQGAVSHQIRELETRLGASLFERQGRGRHRCVG